MNQLIDKFGFQLNEALDIGSKIEIKPHHTEINKAFVAGLGGSGIGADFVAAIIRNESSIPYLVGKGYGIPAYVDQNTLAIASSYSGNTEETLFSFEQFLETGAKVVVIASGGKLIEKAKEHGFDYIQVPGNWPSPRACLGYSMVQQLALLNRLKLISTQAIDGVTSSIQLLKAEESDIKKKAKEVAQLLFNKIPVIYSSDHIEPVALRLRQQINENAKALCWHHVIPEMNHNELVGWRDKNENLAVVYLRTQDDFSRNALRIDINKEILSKYSSTIIELHSKGDNLVEQMMYLVNLSDWISFYLSEMRGVDSIEVHVIDYLKKELSKVK